MQVIQNKICQIGTGSKVYILSCMQGLTYRRVMLFMPVFFFSLITNDLFAQTSTSLMNNDSIWIERLNRLESRLSRLLPLQTDRPGMSINDIDSLKKEQLSLGKRKQHLRFSGGNVQYGVYFQSLVDTPFYQPNLVQQVQQIQLRFVVADFLPVQFSYMGRMSNSPYFKDFFDFRVDIEPHLIRQTAQSMYRDELLKRVDSIRNNSYSSAIDNAVWNLNSLRMRIEREDIDRALIECRERLMNRLEWNNSDYWQDSARRLSYRFLSVYQQISAERDSLQRQVDSITVRIRELTQKLGKLKKNIEQPDISLTDLRHVGDELSEIDGKGNQVGRYPKWLSGLDRFSVGRTMPSISPLTMQNLNVKGINMAYSDKWWFADAAAGIVDFRIRDFVNRKTMAPSRQWGYAAKAGWGTREGTHVAIAAFGGKKQVFNGYTELAEISGLSVGLQLKIAEGHKVFAEIAQSSAPHQVSTGKKLYRLTLADKSSRAYYISSHSHFKRMRATVQAAFQYMGINFQNFNSFRVNGVTQSWNISYRQEVWKRRLIARLGIRKNDLSNTLLPQKFESNSVIRTAYLTFRKARLPVVSIGLMPGKQLVVADSLPYELNYETVTANISHTYRVGIASLSTSIMYSSFYLKGNALPLLSGNSRQFNVQQHFVFPIHESLIGVSILQSDSMSYNVFQMGAKTQKIKPLELELGCRIFAYNKVETKAGGYMRLSLNGGKWGRLSANWDDYRLPSIRHVLYRNQQFSVMYSKIF